MVVTYTEQGWEIVSQRAHGLLAAAIANNWSHQIRDQRWIETLVAIAEHDDAQIELERTDLLTSQGGPVDFKMRKLDYGHCQQTMTRAYNKSIWIALLCSTHLDFLCQGDPVSDVKLKKFITDQKRQRLKWMKQLGVQAQELKRSYRLLEWCDALSLLICQHGQQPEGRTVQISTGPDGESHQLKTVSNETLTVHPWPFEQDQFQLQYEARVIDQLAFRSTQQFKQVYQKCIPKIRTWNFTREVL